MSCQSSKSRSVNSKIGGELKAGAYSISCSKLGKTVWICEWPKKSYSAMSQS